MCVGWPFSFVTAVEKPKKKKVATARVWNLVERERKKKEQPEHLKDFFLFTSLTFFHWQEISPQTVLFYLFFNRLRNYHKIPPLNDGFIFKLK